MLLAPFIFTLRNCKTVTTSQCCLTEGRAFLNLHWCSYNTALLVKLHCNFCTSSWNQEYTPPKIVNKIIKNSNWHSASKTVLFSLSIYNCGGLSSQYLCLYWWCFQWRSTQWRKMYCTVYVFSLYSANAFLSSKRHFSHCYWQLSDHIIEKICWWYCEGKHSHVPLLQRRFKFIDFL